MDDVENEEAREPADEDAGWVRQAEIDGGMRAGTTTADADRIAQLEQEVRELRRTNHILRTSAAFFAAASVFHFSETSAL